MDDPHRGRGILGGNVPNKPNSPYVLRIGMVRLYSGVHTRGADTWLQALDKSIIGHKGRVGLHS